jgi:hypothetical protein
MGKKTIGVSLRMLRGLHSVITRKAQDEKRSFSNQMVMMLEKSLTPAERAEATAMDRSES